MLMLAAVLVPVLEFFDRWDPPGPGSDTEFAVFGIVMLLCLLLAVSRVVASLDGMMVRVLVGLVAAWSQGHSGVHRGCAGEAPGLLGLAASPPPLRI